MTQQRTATQRDAKPLRLALVVSNLEFGGAERQVVQLARALDRERFDVHICSLSPYLPLAEGVPELAGRLHVVGKKGRYDVTVIPRLRALFRQLGTDLAHGFLFDAQLATRLAGRLARVPLVIDSERNSGYHVRLIQRLAFRLTRGCVDLVIANSRAGAEFHQRLYGHRQDQYRIVYNGVDTERFRPLPGAAVRSELGLPAHAPVVGMFGSYKPQKNHPLLLAAAARLAREHPAARFLFVGDQLAGALRGTDRQRRHVAELVQGLGLEQRCVFEGNRSDLERLYNACDVTALPSSYEGTPNVVLESLACGVPVVATDVGDVRRVVPEGRVGFVVPPRSADALALALGRLLGSAELRARLAANARQWVTERFSLERLASEAARVYEEAWRGRGRLGGGALAAPRAAARR